MMQSSDDKPHRRFNLLTNSWVLCSPHRAKRPWLGQVEKSAPSNLPQYDPNCYLCPGEFNILVPLYFLFSKGNKRAANEFTKETQLNPNYSNTFVFPNDFPALLPEEKPEEL